MSRPLNFSSISIALVCLLLAPNFWFCAVRWVFYAPIFKTNLVMVVSNFAFGVALQRIYGGGYLNRLLVRLRTFLVRLKKPFGIGAVLYALGLLCDRHGKTVCRLNMGAGFLMGMGNSATGFGVVFACLWAQWCLQRSALFALGL